MRPLPMPDLPTGPHRDLVVALHGLHHHAGWPSLRRLASGAGCSHTTVSKAFSSPAVPSWGTLELLVEALDGDTAQFRDLWLAATTPTNGSGRAAPTIAGRRTELAAVRRHLETGSGLLLVTGEAGIGKTTLVEAAAAGIDATVATGHCLPLSIEAPLMPVADALRSVLERDGGRWFEEALAESAAYVRGALTSLLPELMTSADAFPANAFARQHLFAAVAGVLEALGRLHPLGLFLEDLHWSDASTLELAERLGTTPVRVPVVATWRTDDPATSVEQSEWFVRVRRLPATTTLEVGPLDLEETAVQVEMVTGTRLSHDRAQRIYRRSRGHPLFTTHLASAPEQALPVFLAQVLDGRLEGLSAGADTVITTLAVADRGLPVPVLQVASGLERPELLRALRELAAAHLLAPAPTQDAQLAHPLLAESARRRLVSGEAADVHRRLAAALSGTPDHAPAEIAQHWQSAGDHAAELTWRVRAALDAQRRIAARTEVDHWLRALELWDEFAGPDLDVTRVEAELELIVALEEIGHDDVALRRALALLAQEGLTADERFEAHFHAASYTWGQRGPEQALALLDGIDTARDGDTLRAVRVLTLRANLLAAIGRHDDAAAASAAAVRLAREDGRPRTLFRALSCHVWHLGVTGDLAGATRAADECTRTLEETWGPGPVVGLAMMLTDVLLIHACPADEVVAAGSTALGLIEFYDLTDTQSHLVRANAADALLTAGRVWEAESVLGEVEPDAGYAAWPLKVMAAWAAAMRGEPTRALQLLNTAHQQDALAQLLLGKIAAEALLWSGRPEELLDRTLGTLEAILASPQARFAARPMVLVARAVADLGRQRHQWHARLVRLRGEADIDPLGPGPVPGDRAASTAQWAAELARLEGSETVEMWLRAATGWDQLCCPRDAAYCRWRAAQVALRGGRGTVASRLLKRAATDAREHVPLSRAIAATAVGAR